MSLDGLRIRENVEALSDDELAALRAAFAAMYETLPTAGRSAGTRYPSGPLFPPWNRAELNRFELGLRRFAPHVCLPYWDWTSHRSRQDGIPSAFVSERLVDGQANPLRVGAGSIEIVRGHGDGRGDPNKLPSGARIDDLLALDDYDAFCAGLEQLHDDVHEWCGGTLSLVDSSAADPLFWPLQAMVDRIWWLWQMAHPSAPLAPALPDAPLAPSGTLVSDVLDTYRMGYTYRDGPRPARAEMAVHPSMVADLPAEEDSFGFDAVVAGMSDVLDDTRTELPLALAVSGRWGAGKSSLMRQLKDRLDSGRERCWYTVWLDTWKYQGSERLWAALTKEVYEQAQQRMSPSGRVRFRLRLEWRRRLFVGGDRRRLNVAGLARVLLVSVGPSLLPFTAALVALLQQRSQVLVQSLAAGGFGALAIFVSRSWGVLADPFKRAIQGYVDRAAKDLENQVGYTTDADHDVHCLADVLLRGDRALAIFVDDLDRCSPKNVVELVETVNQVFNSFPGRRCVFVLGMDREIVISSIEASFGDVIASLQRSDHQRAERFGGDFLDKIVQLTIRVPRPDEAGMERLLERMSGGIRPPAPAPSTPAHGPPETDLPPDRGAEAARPPDVEAGARELSSAAVQMARDTGGVAEAERYLLHRLPRNPRLLKRFINAFRLQLWVAIRSGQRPMDVDSMIALGRWVAISMERPDLADAAFEDHQLLVDLDRQINDSRAGAADPSTARWLKDGSLKGLLEEPSHTRRITAISPESFLRLS